MLSKLIGQKYVSIGKAWTQLVSDDSLNLADYREKVQRLISKGSHAGCMGRRCRHWSYPLYRLATDPGLCAVHQWQVQEGLNVCGLLCPTFCC
ncbi:hypothetical protein QTP70_028737 [Hemibagrus guttatus]|uniref:Uncharacterized protein n=1 Tax=Hemibagrus guttatus TaxID=175788 RepID=A0AAE0UQ50_9TELE|nr:hypothetical protein QTP70_028737 [Hemibagrus guttatus]KAK3534483.1 hypothetical protein QTP86_015169 [Hemibagrus guttatus]